MSTKKYTIAPEVILYGNAPDIASGTINEIKIRRNKGKKFSEQIKSAETAAEFLRKLYGTSISIQEYFICMYLNQANECIGFYRHTVGTNNSTQVDIKIVMAIATQLVAQGLIISHNHPSGHNFPSPNDKNLTKAVKAACQMFSITLLDHLIMVESPRNEKAKYYSFADHNEESLAGISKSNNMKITVSNITEEYPRITVDLPEALSKKEFVFIQENIDLYNEDPDIKKYIDTFIEKLNQYLGKHKPKSKPAHTRELIDIHSLTMDPAYGDIVTEIEKLLEIGTSDAQGIVDAHAAFVIELLNKGKSASSIAKLLDKKSRSPKNKNAKRSKKQRSVSRGAKKVLKSERRKASKPPKRVKKAKTPQGNAVEKVSPEIQFIRRYIGLNGKNATKEDLLKVLNPLQKAILEKRIRKTSAHAEIIEHIQEQLIKAVNTIAGGSGTLNITFDQKSLEKYQTIAHSQHPMLSVSYIRQYISMHGKKGIIEKAKALMARIKKAVEKKKINKEDPYAGRLQKIYESLDNYIQKKTDTPVLSKSDLAGLQSISGLSGLDVQDPRIPIDKIVSAADLKTMKFPTIGFKGKWKELLGDPNPGFSMMIWGAPKCGKSTFALQMAKYCATNHGKTLFAAIEEGINRTLQDKIMRLKADHPDLYIIGQLPPDLSTFSFVFIDSVNRSRLTRDQLLELQKKYPQTAFIYIFQVTKDVNYRGSQEIQHDVDITVHVDETGTAHSAGRFAQGRQMKIFDMQ